MLYCSSSSSAIATVAATLITSETNWHEADVKPTPASDERIGSVGLTIEELETVSQARPRAVL